MLLRLLLLLLLLLILLVAIVAAAPAVASPVVADSANLFFFCSFCYRSFLFYCCNKLILIYFTHMLRCSCSSRITTHIGTDFAWFTVVAEAPAPIGDFCIICCSCCCSSTTFSCCSCSKCNFCPAHVPVGTKKILFPAAVPPAFAPVVADQPQPLQQIRRLL